VTCFLDTSALVKLYVPETGHEPVAERTSAPIIAADVALVEFPAALYRKHRMGELSARSAHTISRAFRAAADRVVPDLDLHLVSTELPVIESAAEIVARHPLRAYDAMQLAAAMSAAQAVPALEFGSFDQRLNTAALAEGLALAF